ncbi:MAG: glycine cleavage system protein T [Candidatus Melainabacteria bacterium HGW-Melainabacteria-1]|nr:MAG: glycine cleavage system protein T [Candidatus Melainabacteria bacterium HGW-Melainabacteria-1]
MSQELTSKQELKRTPLNSVHRALGAKMVDFGGWDMPVQYHSILKEHDAVRQRAGLFDVSHMGVYELRGPQSLAAVQHLIPNDAARLQPGQGLYSQLCNAEGGTIDDLLVFCLKPERWWLIVNAGNRQADFDWIQSQLDSDGAELVSLADNLGILALQGPKAQSILSALTDVDLSPASLPAFGLIAASVAGVPVQLSRSGYTGEDGFELYISHADLAAVWQALIDAGRPHGLEPVGLGARDTLRLEAAMPLYGHELDCDTSPLEAGLGWSVKLQKPTPFIGQNALRQQKEQGLRKRRIGFVLEGKRAPRQGCELYLGQARIGVVTSGSLSPTLGHPVGMAYVDAPWCEDLPEAFEIDIRGQRHAARRVKLPFYRRSSQEINSTS